MLAVATWLLGVAPFTAPARASSEKPREVITIATSGQTAVVSDAIAAAFAARFEAPIPRVTETPTRSAFDEFCSAVNAGPDVVVAGRRMSHAELGRCRRAEAGDIVEIPIGYEVAVFVTRRDGPALDLTPDQLFDLVAANGSRPARWADAGVAEFGEDVRVLMPPPDDPAFDIIRERILIMACRDRPGIRDMRDAASRTTACGSIRDDAGIVSELDQRQITRTLGRGAVGLVGNSVFQHDNANLQPVLIDGERPTILGVVSGSYPAARPLFVYAKADRMRNGRGRGKVRGLRDLAEFIAGDEIIGPQGVLGRLGLIMAPAERRVVTRMRTMALVPFNR
ncbi:hypothetical protein N825_33220 [Skermanella stibiiresistens SB22]|uniref:PBP domain-containing protein n=2 Tax=Skermanella TaxID=204447 RepID=W9H7X6_9PROT|nr:hypothetical protein N825_33220 [Skermanella stibiiresistens SB22]